MPKIISREQAIAQGLNRYFTGLFCKHGHIAERGVRNRGCVQCFYEARRKRYRADPAYREKIRLRNLKLRRRHKAERRSIKRDHGPCRVTNCPRRAFFKKSQLCQPHHRKLRRMIVDTIRADEARAAS